MYLMSDIIIASFQENAPLFASYFHLLYPLTFFFVTTALLEAFSRSHHETYLPTFLREVLLRLITTILIIGFSLNIYDFNIFIYLYAYSFGISTVVLTIYLISRHHHKLFFRIKIIRSLPLREVLTFSSFSFMTSAATVFMLQVDKVMVSNIISDEATGVYALAIYLATLIEVPRRAITQTLGPIIAKAWKTSDIETLKSTYYKASVNQQIIGSLLFCLLWINIDNIYEILPKKELYATGKYVVLFIGGSKLLDMIFGINGEMIGYSKYFKFNFYATIILALLAIATNLFFIKHYGMNGAALASLLSLFIFNVAKYIFIWNKFHLHAFSLSTVKLFGIAIVLTLLMSYFPKNDNFIVDIIIKSLLFATSYLFLTYQSKASDEYNEIIDSLINKVLKRI